MINLIITEDQPIVRTGLRLLLEAEPDFSVIAETDNSPASADLVVRLKPDVVIIDLTLPELRGLGVLRRVANQLPQPRTVVISMHCETKYALKAFAAGATAYVLKSADSTDLTQAVRGAIAGQRFVSEPLSLLEMDHALHHKDKMGRDPMDILSDREREILHLIAHGFSSRQIGDYLSISPRTVEVHRAKLMHKLNLRRHSDVIRFAVQSGL